MANKRTARVALTPETHRALSIWTAHTGEGISAKADEIVSDWLKSQAVKVDKTFSQRRSKK